MELVDYDDVDTKRFIILEVSSIEQETLIIESWSEE